jgi:prophage tail gpP-like protein
MPPFTSDDIGAVNDKVTLRLGGETVLVAESYDVRMSWFRQPAVFALRTGWGGTTLDLLLKYPPNTPFELLVADRVQFTGRIDAVNAEQGAGATEVTLHGRDDLAPLHDAFATADRSFDGDGYDDVVSKLLDAAGITDYTLIFENNGNRDRKTGVQVPATTGARVVFGRTTTRATRKQKKAGQLKLGEQLYGFAKKELDQAGLFLFAAANTGDGPTFIITEPNKTQVPMARIVRRRGQTRNLVSVERASFVNNVAKRYCEAIVYGRGGDPKNGQQPVRGSFLDNEMLLYGFPRSRAFTQRVDTVSTADQADFLARKMIAEQRRDGWSLTYTVTGHTVPALNGRTSRDRAVWCVDAVIECVDDEYGLAEPLWISDVVLRRDGSGTYTDITLCRLDDLIFAPEA